MNKKQTSNDNQEAELSEEDLKILSTSPSLMDEVDVSSDRMKSLRASVMMRIDESEVSSANELLTIRADAGSWKKISDKIRKKVLHVDKEKGVTSYLLQISPGAEDDPHCHTSDEHCMVLEGDVSFGDIHLHAGDYHLAPKGSMHEKAYSQHGALLYIQTGIEQSMSI